jgi:dTDP-4-dehydrorhamnose 3,5-epimerase
MNFQSTPLAGAFVIEPQKFRDERGFFCYSFDRAKFEKLGLPAQIVQSNISYNARKGTLRGMHFQIAPMAQPKLVRCTAGAIYDVIIDLRADSTTHSQWFGAELSADNHRALYIPAGFAHGFQTLADGAEVLYDMFEQYAAETARGVRYDDPAFGIRWPVEVSVISERDRTYADHQL